jgi:simple sugar transport system permease protein
LILGFNAVRRPAFLRIGIQDGRLVGIPIDILNRASPVMLLSIGMTLVLATGGVDLSVGAVMAIAGSVAAILLQTTHLPFAAVVAAALLATLLAGLWNGLLVAFLDLQPIVATLILMVAGRGIAQLLTAGQIPTVENPCFTFIGNGPLLALPFTLTLVLVTFLATALLTRRTSLGLFIESVGNNATASRYAGVNSRLVKLLVYVFSGLCAGLAGLIVASNIKAADANNAGLYLELDAILAVVIGGTSLNGGRFSLLGSLIGALIIQSVTTTILVSSRIPPEANLVVKSIVVLAVCLLQSDTFRQRLHLRFRSTQS